MLTLALAAAVAATAVAPDPVVAELTRLERQWGEAFVKRDFAFIEQIVAPEYRLVVAQPDGSIAIIRRDQWLRTRATGHTRHLRPKLSTSTASGIRRSLRLKGYGR